MGKGLQTILLSSVAISGIHFADDVRCRVRFACVLTALSVE